MADTGNRFTGTYRGRRIELARGDKSLKLFVDGQEAASLTGNFAGSVGGSFEHDGLRHAVTARATSHSTSTAPTVEVDGNPLPLTAAE